MYLKISAMITVVLFLFSGAYVFGAEEECEKITLKEDTCSMGYEYVNCGGVRLKTRSLADADLSLLKESEGVETQGRDYNVKIDGFGTGLRPPNSEEWETIGDGIKMVDGVDTPDGAGLNSSKFHNGTKYFPPIGNQGSEGSCVSWSVGYYTKTFMEAKDQNWNLSGATMTGSWPYHPTSSYQDKIMSPDFLYHQVNDGMDTGSYYSDNIYVCQRTGICSWEEMPYDDDNHTRWPSEEAWREAPLYRSESDSTYWMYTTSNSTIKDLKEWVDDGNLATISINAYKYSSLSNDTWNKTVQCGTGRNHANTIVGYDDNFGPYTEDGVSRRGAFLVANSWGKGWSGDSNSDGMYWITYECMRTQVQYVYYMADRIDYRPEALALFNLSHTKRGECQVTLGVGSTSSPNQTKRFDYYTYNGGDHPYPSNMMALDITEFSDSVSSYIGNNYFIKMYDGGTSTTGSIQSFSLELYDNYSEEAKLTYSSTDPVVNTVASGNVYAGLTATDDEKPRLKNDTTPSSGTTGDQLNFSVEVTDNGLISGVYVNYSAGAGYSRNMSMNDSTGDTWKLSVVVPDILENITYSFHAKDGGGNWNRTLNSSVAVTDDDEPMLITHIPVNCTTGEKLNLTVEATDNIELDYVEVSYEYQYGPPEKANLTHGSDNNWSKEITVKHLPGNIEVNFKALDTSGNIKRTSNHSIGISDNDRPWFVEDRSDPNGTTGDQVTFAANLSDNIQVASAWVVYDDGKGFSGNVSMDNEIGQNWSAEVTCTEKPGNLTYNFGFNDTSGNQNRSGNLVLEITDNDPPLFSNRIYPEVTTGDNATFGITCVDNLAPVGVWMVYRIANGTIHNVSMTGSVNYTVTIRIPSDATEMISHYYTAVDAEGNWAISSSTSLHIFDDDSPVLESDHTPDHGTCGDPFLFNFSLSDNREVDSVHLEFWFGTETHNNISLSLGSYHTYGITIPSDSVDDLHYIIHASDKSGNWFSTVEKSVTVVDDDKPVLLDDMTPDTGTTGESITFDLSAGDNIELLGAYVEYWFEGGAGTNSSMTGDGRYILTVEVPGNLTGNLSYRFRFSDTSGNWNVSEVKVIRILDNDAPVLIEDRTPNQATTGDPFTFSADISDNIGMESVRVLYRFGSGDENNISLSEDGSWSVEITIPSDSLDQLTYRLIFRDTSGNRNSTDPITVPVADNDQPVLIGFYPEGNATTGDPINMTIEVEDNIGLVSCELVYRIGEGMLHNITLSGDGPYFVSIGIPSDASGNVSLTLHMTDGAGNYKESGAVEFGIYDDESPIISSVGSPEEAGCGEEITISAEVSDNWGVSTVVLEYRFGGAEEEMIPMESDLDGFTATVTIPDNSTEQLRYRIRVNDTSGNEIVTTLKEIVVSDRSDPVISGIRYTTPELGESAVFYVDVSDNIGVQKIEWTLTSISEGWVVPFTGEIMREDIPAAGEYSISVKVSDAAGNTAEYSDTFTVSEENPDRDGDGIENNVELEHGLDPDDPSDASADADGDGLTNKEEIELGTRIDSDDSDSDGMSDGWEHKYGLDPLTPSSDEDTDGDGVSDLEEYTEGSDPTAGPGEDEGSNLVLYILLAAVLIVILVAAAVGFLLMTRARKKEESEEEEVLDWD